MAMRGHIHHLNHHQGREASRFAPRRYRHSQAGAWERECVTSVNKSPNIDSLFGVISSSTDGMEFQKAMREE